MNIDVEEQKDSSIEICEQDSHKRSFLLEKLTRHHSLPLHLADASPLLKKQQQQRHNHHVLLLREAHVSLEHLNPHPECQTRKSTSVIAVFNLVATVCGGGVLSLPLAFARAGILPTTALMIYAALATDFTLYLLVACARRTGGRSYGDVAQAAFGNTAQVMTTSTVAIMLCGTLIAYQILVRDIWAPVVFTVVPTLESFALKLGGNDRNAANLLLAAILVIAMPLLLKKDLHALRHTCYVGFSSCVLLMIAVIYRATEEMQLPHDDGPRTIKWYSKDLSDILFAFPIVVLCFFCSYNVLGVHSQLVQPTRKRLRIVLDSSITICFVLFYGVGLGGYVYAGDATLDNILLNFPIDDKAILAGRAGFCLTLMFGLPLILLPCREAAVSIPEQLATWRRNTELMHEYEGIWKERESGAHLVINGVDFDEKSPFLVAKDPKQRHGVTLQYYGDAPLNNDSMSTVDTTDDHHSSHLNEQKEDDRGWRESLVHVASTVTLLGITHIAAITAPGVASVWAIFGSSMAVFIAFIVPAGCYLKIREHKGLTWRAICGWFVLILSCILAVVCTRNAILNALL